VRNEADSEAFRILTLFLAVSEQATAALERLEPPVDAKVTHGIKNISLGVYRLLMTETRFRTELEA
jgi:hypothetical protein